MYMEKAVSLSIEYQKKRNQNMERQQFPHGVCFYKFDLLVGMLELTQSSEMHVMVKVL